MIYESTISRLRLSLKEKNVVVLRNNLFDDIQKVVSDLGEIIPAAEDQQTGNKNGDLFIDIKYKENDPTNSFIFSNTRQPLHTDGSYESSSSNINFFFCRESPKYGGFTLFLDNKVVEDTIETNLLHRLQNITVRHFKGEDERIKPILEIKDNTWSWNWNYYRVERNPETEMLINDFKSYLDHLEQAQVCDSVKLHQGDIVFFWDERQLHGRTAFFGNRWLWKGGLIFDESL